MAELALPIIGLGALYVYSNKDKKQNKEKNHEAFNNRSNILPNTEILNKNFPKQNQEIDKTNKNYIREFPNSNQTTDKFFNNDISNKMLDKNMQNKEFKSLTGDCFIAEDFKHNNMVPFFGSKVTQSSNNRYNSHILDQKNGTASQTIKKTENAPLFKPQEHVQYSHGAPVQTDFIQSRQLPSRQINNVLPWQQEKIAPGLGLGYTTEGSGGFNSGMQDREKWLPPTVDSLRTTTNPKMSYTLAGHEGAIASQVKNMGTIGSVEKNRPDKTFEKGPEHWFTTTGSSIGQMSHPQQMLHETNHCSTEYFGIGSSTTNQGQYTKSYSEAPHRIEQTKCTNINPATALGKGPASENNYGIDGYKILNNNRSENCKQDNHNFGIINAAVKGMFAPILDILKPTRKEDVIYNANQLGNIQASVPRLPVTNPEDTLKTTNKEMIVDKIGLNYLNVSHINSQNGGGYESATPFIKSQQRNFGDSSSHGFIGNTQNAQMDVGAWNEQHNNVNKTYENWPNPGGTQVFSSNVNMDIVRKDKDRVNNRMTPEDYIKNIPNDATMSVPSAETFGKINMPQVQGQTINTQRISGDILKAFKSNPYTQSLQSY